MNSFTNDDARVNGRAVTDDALFSDHNVGADGAVRSYLRRRIDD